MAGRVADPIVRGLHVRWVDGPAEGWSWVQVRPDACLVERVSVTEHRFSCGIDAARLAEDLAAVAVGERLRDLTRRAGPAAARRIDRADRRAEPAPPRDSSAVSPSTTSAPTDAARATGHGDFRFFPCFG